MKEPGNHGYDEEDGCASVYLMSTATLMTVEQFAEMKTADTEDYELVKGELVPLASGTPRHNAIRDNLGDALRSYVRRNRSGKALAEIDCQISDDIVRRPDVAVFLGERSRRFDPDRVPVPFAPDIAAEILSPSEAAVDVNRKALEYLAAGCQEVWIVDHENSEVFVQTSASIRLIRGADLLDSPLLPGFSQAVADLLAW